MNLDIDGFLYSTPFLAALASIITALLMSVFGGFLGGVLNTTG